MIFFMFCISLFCESLTINANSTINVCENQQLRTYVFNYMHNSSKTSATSPLITSDAFSSAGVGVLLITIRFLPPKYSIYDAAGCTASDVPATISVSAPVPAVQPAMFLRRSAYLLRKAPCRHRSLCICPALRHTARPTVL